MTLHGKCTGGIADGVKQLLFDFYLNLDLYTHMSRIDHQIKLITLKNKE